MLRTWVTPGTLTSFLLDKRSTKSVVVCRNYMTQDIMRRILRDYFGYELHFVTNITDVDDKVSQI